jgi:hypothetical protein
MFNRKPPSDFVTVELEVPFSCTVTPSTGWPLSSVIFPVTGKLFCEIEKRERQERNTNRKMLRSNTIFLFIIVAITIPKLFYSIMVCILTYPEEKYHNNWLERFWFIN